jgi:hypothetical protein
MTQSTDQRSKDEMEKDKIKQLLSEAEKQALTIIEEKYPAVVAREFTVPLPVGWQMPDDTLFENAVIQKVTVRRQNRSERRNATTKVITSNGKYTNADIANDKMLSLITTLESSDGQKWDWTDVPQKLRNEILGAMDIIDEDEIIEGMTALEYGFGNFKDFYASQAFRSLKEQEAQSFRGNEEEI